MDRNEWLHYFYDAIAVPHTAKNARVGVTWIQSEGSQALWNPLACVKVMPGSWRFNSIGVQNYPDWATGQRATIQTIEQNCCGFPTLLSRLQSPWTTAKRKLKGIGQSEWGTDLDLLLAVYPSVVNDYWQFASKTIPGS